VLYTDGLEDAKGLGGDRFGVARVTHTLTQVAGRSPDKTVTSLRQAVCAFRGRQAQRRRLRRRGADP
jgi:serine phosphatase RsbU (regulator of sigma subunit)